MVAKRAVIYVKSDVYLQQKWMDCGAYAVRAVTNLYGVDKDLPPRKYLTSLGKLFFGFMWPSTISKILEKKKFKAPLLRAINRKNKLHVLKKYLEKGYPIITLINNVYNARRERVFIKRYYALHWVTLLGYDDEKKLFYIYDSYLHKRSYEKDLPVGNVSMSYDDFLKFWKGKFIARLFSYLYIPVVKNEVRKKRNKK